MSDLIRLGETDIELIDGDRGNNYPSKSDFFEKEFCLFLDANNISNNGFDFSSTHFITKEKDKKLKKGKLQKNDIVMMTRGSVGNVALYDESVPFNNIRINSGMLIIRCHNDYNPLFLYYMLKSEFIRKQIDDIMSGSVQKQLPVSVLQNLLLFPENEKSVIIETLSIIDKKIKNNNVINADLEEMAKTIYDYWFLQFEFPDEEGKPYKSSGGKMVWNKELKREIPEGWRYINLENIAQITMGSSPKGVSLNNYGEGIVFYQGNSDFGDRFPRERVYTNAPVRYAEEYDILLSVRAPVGELNIADKKCCIGRGLAAIHSKYQSFTYYLLLSNLAQFYKYNNDGTTFGAITKKELQDIKVIIPKEALQKEFNDRIGTIDKQIFLLSKENQELISLRDFLLPLLMNGQVSFEE